MNPLTPDSALVGISDHGGWAILVTVSRNGDLLDRRRVDLVAPDVPKLPHHSEGQTLPPAEAIALVERVRASAEEYAARALEALARDLQPVPIHGVALRYCPPLPPTIAERIADYRAHNLADWVMYRQTLAAAAEARGWSVHWYDAKTLPLDALEPRFRELRRTLGPPWDKDHKLAMAAALTAVGTGHGA